MTTNTLSIAATLLMTSTLWITAADYKLQGNGLTGGGGRSSAPGYRCAGSFAQLSPGRVASAAYVLHSAVTSMPTVVQNPAGPRLRISRRGLAFRISWPQTALGFQLEAKTGVGASAAWTGMPGPYYVDRGEHYVLVIGEEAMKTYRLRQP